MKISTAVQMNRNPTISVCLFVAAVHLSTAALALHGGERAAPHPNPPTTASTQPGKMLTMEEWLAWNVQLHGVAESKVNALAEEGNSVLYYPVQDRRADVVSALLKKGDDPKLCGPKAIPPVVMAEGAALDALLAAGADPNASWARTGDSALCNAARAGNPATVKTLLSHHADVNHANLGGMTPLAYAADNGTPEVIGILLDAGAKFGPAEARSALEFAVMSNKVANIKFLIAKGADVNGRDELGSTILMDVASMESSEEGIKALIAAGADVNAKDHEGLTAFLRSTNGGISKILLDAGADPKYRPAHP